MKKFTKIDEDHHLWTGKGQARGRIVREQREGRDRRFWTGALYDANGGLCLTTNGSFVQVRTSMIKTINRMAAEKLL